MKVLVTGAAGFIGFHVSKALAERGDIVVGLDNINDYYDINLKYARLHELGIHSEKIKEDQLTQSTRFTSLQFIKLDITFLEELNDLFAKEKFDQVIHLAAQAGVRYSIENPHAYVQSNLVGFVDILECCRHHKIEHLVYASSSSVYGNNKKVPFSEKDRVDYPVSLYAATKKSNELMAHTYSHLYQLPTTGLRFFTVYGPWGRPDMAPMLFANAIMKSKLIKVFNKGNLERDFTYINDIVNAVVKVADNIPQMEADQPFYRILNVGNSDPVKLHDFILKLEEAFVKKAILELVPMQPGDVKQTYASTKKMMNICDYRPETNLTLGIENFVNWFKNFYKC
ncbi:NAD-dependent epimerase/dehydratase family protein [Marinilabilia salmonicolor]|uniref:UDP-glucuronate 4-epimerase n=1 Tax=Marinilabilia salmonicolor TaxID=989 RepID=A0A368UPE6_9BACT|nr:NAD-dependent epimerase/dehydratase family protein [Marinilabilia salmonicolor]RCW30045.1 UDP-glucuronate 4-epimerase [Marinilabilia salmonicolor]